MSVLTLIDLIKINNNTTSLRPFKKCLFLRCPCAPHFSSFQVSIQLHTAIYFRIKTKKQFI